MNMGLSLSSAEARSMGELIIAEFAKGELVVTFNPPEGETLCSVNSAIAK
jgi:hypothetical protein